MSDSNSTIPEGFEYASCALCGRDDARPFLECGDLKRVAFGTFTLVRCSCGLVYLNPRPGASALAGIYSGEKFDYYTGGTAGHAARRAEIVKSHVRAGRILDAGTGDGSFLAHMKSEGWEAVGVEPDEGAARRQKESLGLDVRTGTIHTAKFEPGSFDAVTYWDVFEHVAEPLMELRKVNELLSPGGAAVFSLPNIASVESRVFGAGWYRLDVPRHLYHYSPRTLRAMLEKAGFDSISITCSTTATGVLNSLRPDRVAERQPAEQGAAAAQAGVNKSVLKKLVFNLGLVPVLRALDAAMLGGHMVAVASDSKS